MLLVRGILRPSRLCWLCGHWALLDKLVCVLTYPNEKPTGGHSHPVGQHIPNGKPTGGYLDVPTLFKQIVLVHGDALSTTFTPPPGALAIDLCALAGSLDHIHCPHFTSPSCCRSMDRYVRQRSWCRSKNLKFSRSSLSAHSAQDGWEGRGEGDDAMTVVGLEGFWNIPTVSVRP